MSRCNRGQVVQTLTRRSAAEIHAAALERCGDGREQTRDHCPASGLATDAVNDAVNDELLAAGLTLSDLHHLEDWTNPAVLVRVPACDPQLDAGARPGILSALNAAPDGPPPGRCVRRTRA
jgi:hypothetical protein